MAPAPAFNEPEGPWQNSWIESFSGRRRDDLLNSQRDDWSSRPRSSLEDWRIGCSINGPLAAHGWFAPVEFVEPSLHP